MFASRTWMRVIRSFHDARTAALFKGSPVRSVAPDLAKRAQRQLRRLDDVASLADLAGFPGCRLKRMQGNRTGQHSVRVNEQWRICFVWSDGNAERVEFCDYH